MTGAPGNPPARHMRRGFPPDATDKADNRLYAPAFARNFPPVLVALTPWLGGRSGTVLEIGCGTGQHAAGFALAFPALEWWPSDPDEGHRASARAWAAHQGAPDCTPLALDAATDWASAPDCAALGPLTAILSMNVIHIAPPAVCDGILAGAAARLDPGGLLIFYGPFFENGHPPGPGNVAFDAGLRAENPEWGLRVLDDLRRRGAALGLSFAALLAMPADNRLLILRRD